MIKKDFEKSNIDVTVFDDRQNENNNRLSTPCKTRRRHKIIGSLPEICRALDKIKLNKLDANSYNTIMKSSCRNIVQRAKSFTNLNKPAVINKRSSLLVTNKILKKNTIQNTEEDSKNETVDKNKQIKTTNNGSESEQSSSKTVVKRTQSFTVLNKPATLKKRASLMSTNKIIKNNSNQNTLKWHLKFVEEA